MLSLAIKGNSIMCIVDGCDLPPRTKSAEYCQKHYMRMYRYGRTHKKIPKESHVTPNGYVRVYSPDHPLAVKLYVFEHRLVYFDQVSKDVDSCDICGKAVTWASVHIDHIDENRQNNAPENLRPLCNTCNTQRNRKPEWQLRRNVITIELDGVVDSISGWIKKLGLDISPDQVRRRLKAGMTGYDALHKPKVTHNGN